MQLNCVGIIYFRDRAETISLALQRLTVSLAVSKYRHRNVLCIERRKVEVSHHNNLMTRISSVAVWPLPPALRHHKPRPLSAVRFSVARKRRK